MTGSSFKCQKCGQTLDKFEKDPNCGLKAGQMDEQAPPVSQPKYRDRRTARFAAGERVREFQAFKEQAERRLDILEVALRREDLMRLPSNRFEALGGGRKGQFSIRINKQWRVCFEWPEEADRPYNIEITDYH